MALGEPRIRWRVPLVVVLTLILAILALTSLLKPLPNSCIMTYMYPTYIPVPHAADAIPGKYGLFLYHEGWKKIDFKQHLMELSGVPVLFIPGNGGSYKQVRSIAAESDRAYNGGPLEDSFYQNASFTPGEAGMDIDYIREDSIKTYHEARDIIEKNIRSTYANHLDWFAVDLEGEHSAMDGRILEEHTDFVVQAIHRVLDQYKESLEARQGKQKDASIILPTSVILVGHSMGGFVARAAVVHPMLRKGAVETIVTLSSPHLSAPIALQPSLGHFFARVNKAWRKGYQATERLSQRLRAHTAGDLSHIVVVSIAGGTNDHQIRSRMASLDGLVPATRGLTIGAQGMLNAWLSTEHQTILWCNQLVVQVAHTLLQLVDPNSGQPFSSPAARLAIFVTRLRSALPQTFDWLPNVDDEIQKHIIDLGKTRSKKRSTKEEPGGNKITQRSSEVKISDLERNVLNNDNRYSCPQSVHWGREVLEKDLYVETSSVTVLAMDGRRRWLDIKRQTLKGKTYFVLVTNLAPCYGIRIHLWPEKDTSSNSIEPLNPRVIEVTRRMVQLPAGPAPRQIEPGGQTEQAPPSGILRLGPKDLDGFRFVTISVAPRPTISGRPPPATSMAVGQFFNSADGSAMLSPSWLLSSAYTKRELFLSENHPLVMNFTVSISLGLLPLSLDVRTASCGISDSVLSKQQGDDEFASLCKLRCFPPVALVWDVYSGLQVIPNLFSETIVVDSSPAIHSLRRDSQETTLVILVDPHCAYNISIGIAKAEAATRFLLMHGVQIAGFAVGSLLFALMQQARAWELDMPLPSLFACLERNLMFPMPFLTLSLGPTIFYLVVSILCSWPLPPILSFIIVSVICHCVANGAMALLATGTMLMFHVVAAFQVVLKQRWQVWVEQSNFEFLQYLLDRVSACFALQSIRRMRSRPALAIGILATTLVFFVHPALGLLILIGFHVWNCHAALFCYRQQNENRSYQKLNGVGKSADATISDHKTSITYGVMQLELFKFHQGLLLLHLTALVMLIPSLIAWAQVEHTLLWFFDSVLSFGIILHGLYATHVDTNIALFSKSTTRIFDSSGISLVYAIGGVYCYISGLLLAPYRAFYALAMIGLCTSLLRFRECRRMQGESYIKRRHIYKHRDY